MRAPATAPTAPPINAPSTGSLATAAPTAAPPRPPMAAPCSVCEHAPRGSSNAIITINFFIVVPLESDAPTTSNAPGWDSIPDGMRWRFGAARRACSAGRGRPAEIRQWKGNTELRRLLLRLDKSSRKEKHGDLYGIERRPLSQIVGNDPEVQA